MRPAGKDGEIQYYTVHGSHLYNVLCIQPEHAMRASLTCARPTLPRATEVTGAVRGAMIMMPSIGAACGVALRRHAEINRAALSSHQRVTTLPYFSTKRRDLRRLRAYVHVFSVPAGHSEFST